jgi:hypothetical protein
MSRVTAASNPNSGYFAQGKNFEDNGFVKRAWTGEKQAGDLDGDGHVSLVERLDKDGDGKIEMWEYAADLNKPQTEEVWTASAVGAPLQERQGWAALREARTHGRFVPTVAERVRAAQDQMIYHPPSGGWQNRVHAASPRSSATAWAGPGTPGTVNYNLKPRSVGSVAQQAMAERLRRGGL